MTRNHSIELEIQQFLQLHKSNSVEADLIFEQILKKAESKDISDFDLNSVATFLTHQGLDQYFFRVCITRLEKKRSIPWAQMSQLLGRYNLLADESLRLGLLEGSKKEQKRWHLLMSSAFLEEEDVRRPEASMERRKFHEDYEKGKYNLASQMQFFFTQHMLEQERKLLQKFEKLYPGDRLISDQKKAFAERNARDILSRKSSSPTPPSQFETKPLAMDEQEVSNHIYASAEPYLIESPHFALDFAILFEMMEDYDNAFSAMKFSDPSLAQRWLYCEILILSRRYLQALDAIAKIETDLAADPETIYACAYMRAQALWGLGEKSTAVEILEGLVMSRPQYRSAHSLLQAWKGAP